MFDQHICANQSQSLLFASPNDQHPENEILNAGQSERMLNWQFAKDVLAAEGCSAGTLALPPRKKQRFAEPPPPRKSIGDAHPDAKKRLALVQHLCEDSPDYLAQVLMHSIQHLQRHSDGIVSMKAINWEWMTSTLWDSLILFKQARLEATDGMAKDGDRLTSTQFEKAREHMRQEGFLKLDRKQRIRTLLFSIPS